MSTTARIALQGLKVDPLTMTQAVDRVFGSLAAGDGGVVLTPNLDHLRRHVRQPIVRPAYANADLVLADGMPLVWASRLQGTPLPERVAGSDLIWTISRRAAEMRSSVFLLGGAPTVARVAAVELLARCPGLRLAGYHCPPFGFLEDGAEITALIEAVRTANPDIVFVGLPSPVAEAVIAKLQPNLPRTWFLGLGVSLSFVSGHVQRAPRWTQRVGLEWLWRLCHEPRLWRRYILDGLPFAASVLSSALVSRLRLSRPPTA
jgi:N-acetylglucosaminyldiphosphoundecaprenol N-acetyl-beta-D-mannosaminyltransferase